MKSRLIMTLLAAGCLVALGNGGQTPEEITKLKKELARRMKVEAVNDTTVDTPDGKVELLKFRTRQDERKKDVEYRIRVTVEMTAKDGKTVFAQFSREQGEVDVEYTGIDIWEFQVPHGDLNRPKITAYAIQYGILLDGEFVPVAEEFSRKLTGPDEITTRTTTRIEFSKKDHRYLFVDSEGETVESVIN
jgi:hypothetical protein